MDKIACFNCKQLGHYGFMCSAPTARRRSAATPHTIAQPLKTDSIDLTMPSTSFERSTMTTTNADAQTHTSMINPPPITSVHQWSNKHHPWFLNNHGRFQGFQYFRELQIKPPQCRNITRLWIYSFIVVSWDPTKSYVPGSWSKYFHAQVQTCKRWNGITSTQLYK
jgi:hypothetical protein